MWKSSHSGREGLLLAAGADYDALIVDRMLPELDGLSLVKTLRATGNQTPVLFVSALGEVDERVKGLRSGGDDYLAKPYAFSELLARSSRCARRRTTAPRQPGDRALYHDLSLDLLARRVMRGGRPIDLQPREFKLLEVLMRHAGQVMTRTMLLEKVWDYRFDPQTNVIDVHISRLRQKIDRGHAAAADPDGPWRRIQSACAGPGRLDSSTFRLTLAYLGLFGLSSAIILTTVFLMSARFGDQQVRSVIEEEVAWLRDQSAPAAFRHCRGSLPSARRSSRTGARSICCSIPLGTRLAGNLSGWPEVDARRRRVHRVLGRRARRWLRSAQVTSRRGQGVRQRSRLSPAGRPRRARLRAVASSRSRRRSSSASAPSSCSGSWAV